MMKSFLSLVATIGIAAHCVTAFAEVTRNTQWQDIPDDTLVSTVVDLSHGGGGGVDTNAVRDLIRPATNDLAVTLRNEIAAIKTDMITDGTNVIHANLRYESYYVITNLGTWYCTSSEGLNVELEWKKGLGYYAWWDKLLSSYKRISMNDNGTLDFSGITDEYEISTSIPNTNTIFRLDINGVSYTFRYFCSDEIVLRCAMDNALTNVVLNMSQTVVPSVVNTQISVYDNNVLKPRFKEKLSIVRDSENNLTAVTVGSRASTNVAVVGEWSFAAGYLNAASGDYSSAMGRFSSSSNDYSFVWNGYQKNVNRPYLSHGVGTFNLNPIGGLSGLYIGEENIAQITNNILSTAERTTTTKITNTMSAVEFDFKNGTNLSKTLYENMTNIIHHFGGSVKNPINFQ